LAFDMNSAIATNVVVTDDSLIVDLEDGPTIAVPIVWYPRMLHASREERNNWRFVGRGEGIHWPELDEDLGIENILSGKPSGESQQSFNQWLEKRQESCRDVP
jgi:hypothetical protein